MRKQDPIGDLLETERLLKQLHRSVIDQQGYTKQLIDELVAWRLEARTSRNFAVADRIRDILLKQDITIQDTKFGHGERVCDIWTKEK